MQSRGRRVEAPDRRQARAEDPLRRGEPVVGVERAAGDPGPHRDHGLGRRVLLNSIV